MRKHKIKKGVTFDENCSEPTDQEFMNEYSKYAKSGWFMIIFILAVIPPFCTDLIRIGTTASDNFETVCIIPPLIRKGNWELSQIRKLTMPEMGRVCTYLNYNYSIFEDLSQREAFHLKSKLKTPETKKCTIKPNIMINHHFRNYTANFFKSCLSFEFKNEAKRFRTASEAFGYILLGILADLYGRKIVLTLSLIILVIGMILVPNAESFYKLILGYVIEGFGIAGIILTNFLLFVELCGKKHRGVFTLYLSVMRVAAKILGYSIKFYMNNYAKTYYLFSIPTTAILFYLYYVPESPRWSLSYGKKRKAWSILENLGVNISKYHFLPQISLNKRYILINNFQILFNVKKYRNTILVLTWILFVKTMVIINCRRFAKIKELDAASHKYMVATAEMFSFFNVLPPFLLFGRYVAMYFKMMIGGIFLVASIFTGKGSTWYILQLLCAQYFYSLEYLVLLYGAELLPTCGRGTGLGLITGISSLIHTSVKYLMKLLIFKTALGKIESIIMIPFLLLGLGLLLILPKYRVLELPDWKRCRSDMQL